MKRINLFKKLALGGAILASTITANAQWTQSGTTEYTNGNVGIGVTNPSYPLHIEINQAYNASTNPYPTGLKLQNNAGSTRIGLDFLTYSTSTQGSKTARIEAQDMGAFTGALAFFTASASDGSSGSITQRMIIDNSGNVGIGTSTPSATLDVNGSARVDNGTLTITPTGNVGWLWVGQFGKPSLSFVAPTGDWQHIHNDGGNLRFSYGGTPSNSLPNNYLTLADGGNVGIGVTQPTAKLHVAGQVQIDNNQLQVNPGSGWLWLGHYGTPTVTFVAPTGDWHHITNDGGNLRFSFGGSPSSTNNPLTIFDGGIVGIATTSIPTAAQTCSLFVAGKIGATSVVVSTSDWSDFVFDESYKLPALSDVETFIKTNKHLPEVPSEKELVEKGVDTGEMLKMHMKKIEELTLYVIDLEKKYNELKSSTKK